MILDYLGHSEILLTIKNSSGESIKILSDTWLSDYSVADLMQRNPIVSIDYEKISPDIVFISHSHMDHLDPYFLVKLYSNLNNKPLLLLPETLTFLKNLLEEKLSCEIKILKNKETFEYKGIHIQGIIFPDWMNTNEADVMTLCVWNNNEIFYTEVDIVPPDSEDGIGYLYKLFSQKDFKTRLYLSTRNELEGNLTIIDLPVSQREEFLLEYKQKRISEMYQHYNNIFSLENEGIKANIYELPGFVRGFIGQGIIFPAEILGCDMLKLQIMSLQENVELETEVAGDFGLSYPIYALNKIGNKIDKCSYQWKGRYVFEDGDLQDIKTIDYLQGKYFYAERDLNCDCSRKLAQKPIMEYNFSLEEGLDKLENYLNNKFVPYQYGRIDANLKNLALDNNGNYVIKLNEFKNGNVKTLGFFIWSLGEGKFKWFEKGNFEPDEVYFIEDLLAFLDGKIELYSNFWSYLEPGTNIFLWECLGANFINNDIVKKKFENHFNLAISGLSSKEFILNILKNLDVA